MRRTRIVCTIGPASESEGAIRALAQAGMNVARLNFSHGSPAWHRERVGLLRKVADETGRAIGILQDLCGPKLRVGELPEEGLDLLPGHACRLTLGPSAAGDVPAIQVPLPALLEALAPGQNLYLQDAQIQLAVEAVGDDGVRCQVLNGGTLHSRQGINAPSAPMAIAAATEKDLRDLRLGVELGVDWVAVSFVRRAADLAPVRSLLHDLDASIPVMAKIEKPEAVENLEEIAAAADGLMVARGDLGVELPLYQVPVMQKEIIRLGNRRGKPVVTATQMLDSMTRNPRPTRAEVSDVANAILDGSDAVMLSGETACGEWPAVVVETMARIAEFTEGHIDYAGQLEERVRVRAGTITDAIAQGACEIAMDLRAAAILCSTTSGATARALSLMRPPAPLIAATPSPETRRRLTLTWGVETLLVPPTENTDERLAATVDGACKAGWIRTGDVVVVVSGTPIGVAGRTNLIKVQTV